MAASVWVAALALAGCGGGGGGGVAWPFFGGTATTSPGTTTTPSTPTNPGAPTTPDDPTPAAVYPRFDPATSDLPFNIDLLFAGTTDGTARVGASTDAVRAALNQLDGFSTSGHFDLLLSGRVDPTTAVASGSVWLFELETGLADPLDMASVTGVRGAADFDVKVVSLDGGTDNAIRLRPTRPLTPGAKYLVALTDGLRDTTGAALQRAPAYAALRGAGSIDSALQPVRTAVQGWETLAAQAVAGASGGALSPGQAQDGLLLSYTFTTTDPTGPLLDAAAPRAAVVAMKVRAGADPGNALIDSVQLDSQGLLPTPAPRAVGIHSSTGLDFNLISSALAPNTGRLYTGYIDLPYYLRARSAAPGASASDFLREPWRPDATLASSLGLTLPADDDGSFNVTRRYPFPARTGMESVPLQLTMPVDSVVPGYAGAANCGQIYAASGYPVVIYVHGVTSDRTSVLALAHTLASRCIATVAIDLPLHGVPANSAFANALNVERSAVIPFAMLYAGHVPRERHFNVAGALGQPAEMNFASPGTNDGSGAQFINLGNLTGTRDHNRQAVMDLLNLNASLDAIHTQSLAFSGPGLDRNRVYVVGVSLGGIVGTVFTTVNQQAIARDVALGPPSALKPIRALVASVAGAQLSQVLARSQTFGPLIDTGLGAFGLQPGSSGYERFFYTAQSAIDAADPVNFAGPLATLGVPVLLQQVNGDLVIPNASPDAPLAGTAALARLLNTTTLGLGSTQLGRGYVRHTAGGHASLLRPDGGAPGVTAEMQSQVVTMVLNNGLVSIGAAAPGFVQAP